jgi:hypothetical protein
MKKELLPYRDRTQQIITMRVKIFTLAIWT